MEKWSGEVQAKSLDREGTLIYDARAGPQAARSIYLACQGSLKCIINIAGA